MPPNLEEKIMFSVLNLLPAVLLEGFTAIPIAEARASLMSS
jgi:hypothetical protein